MESLREIVFAISEWVAYLCSVPGCDLGAVSVLHGHLLDVVAFEFGLRVFEEVLQSVIASILHELELLVSPFRIGDAQYLCHRHIVRLKSCVILSALSAQVNSVQERCMSSFKLCCEKREC
jgi:hypothetical protein